MGKDIRGQETLESMSEAGWYNDWVLEKISKFLAGDILEVGCGIGNFTEKLTKFGKVTAVDVNDEYIKITGKKLEEVAVGFGDIERGKYFFKDKKFDAIVCLNVLEHIKEDKKALSNLTKLLKKDGYLILIVPADQFLYGEIDKSISHFRRYSKDQVDKMVSVNNLKAIFSRRLNLVGGVGWFIAGKILRNKTVNKRNVKIFNLIAPLFLTIESIIEPPIGTSVLSISQK